MSKEVKRYAERDAYELDKAGNYYCRHVSAMTGEGLHSKSDIAAELGWRDMQIDALLAERDALKEAQRWISVDDRLPEPGVTVLVYTPPQPGDYPDDVRIGFDGIDLESDGDYWVDHGEHYEHWCCIAKGGDDIDWHGPSEKAPYTHWMPLPAAPSLQGEQP